MPTPRRTCYMVMAFTLALSLTSPTSSWANNLATTNGMRSAAPEPEQQSAPERHTESLSGFWPTPRMVDSVARRWAAEARQRYELTPEQHAEVEKRLVERWTGFMQNNRPKLQPLLNEYLETRLALEPPTPSQVEAWAKQALPLYNQFRLEVEDGEEEVRGLLNPAQQAKFDQRKQQRHFGLKLFKGNLKRWSKGRFVRAEWWDPPAGWQESDAPETPGVESNTRAFKNEPKNENALDLEMPTRAAVELNAWEKYVEDFCEHYELDRSQRAAAQSMLRELLARARDHIHLHRERIAKLEATIASDDQANPAEVKRDLIELYSPLDRMFQELGERLNKLPTVNQRRHAEKPPQ